MNLLVLKKRRFPHVYKLHKALYGLKQVPQAWYDRFRQFLLSHCLGSSTADPSLFIKHHDDQILILVLYADDMLVTSSTKTMIVEFISLIKLEFAMTDL